jgi:hypothetical protein
MPHAAHASSIEAIDAFRASLLVYISKARPALDEISAETMRVRQWIESDRRLYWETQVRRRMKDLETAKQELFSATMANLRDTASSEIMAVRRAERALREAEDKLACVKKWAREFETRALPLARQLQKLDTLLTSDLPAAAQYLTQIIRTLDAYASATSAPASTPADASSAGTPAPSAPEPNTPAATPPPVTP